MYLNFSITYENELAEFNGVYDQPWIRISSYLLGMGLGYIMHKSKEQINMNRFVIICGKYCFFYIYCEIN